MRRARHLRLAAGTALVELAVCTPFVLMLLCGAGQVGAIAYGNVTVDTAAREAARVGSENPHTALDNLPPSPYTCQAADTYSVCQTARQASGALDPTGLIIVITAPDDVSQVPSDVVRLAGCPNTGGTVTGVVSNLPTGSAGALVLGSGGGTSIQVATDSSGNYTICLPAGGQVLTATATGGGCTYGASRRLAVTAGTSYTANFALPTTCSTPTPEATPSPSFNPSATPAPSGTPVPAGSCANLGPNVDSKYVTVTVKYRVPIFAPFVGSFFANSPNGVNPYREVSSTVTMHIEPCTITQGQ